jgi:hypothetical protein
MPLTELSFDLNRSDIKFYLPRRYKKELLVFFDCNLYLGRSYDFKTDLAIAACRTSHSSSSAAKAN